MLELIHDIGCDDAVKELDFRFRAMLTVTHVKHWRTERNSTYDLELPICQECSQVLFLKM